MNFRTERVGKLMREQLAEMVAREVEFPPGVLATITAVDVDKNLEHAKVSVSVIPSDRAMVVIERLDKQAAHLQHLLLKKINIKPMPRIEFHVDHGFENAAVIEKRLIKEE